MSAVWPTSWSTWRSTQRRCGGWGRGRRGVLWLQHLRLEAGVCAGGIAEGRRRVGRYGLSVREEVMSWLFRDARGLSSVHETQRVRQWFSEKLKRKVMKLALKSLSYLCRLPSIICSASYL